VAAARPVLPALVIARGGRLNARMSMKYCLALLMGLLLTAALAPAQSDEDALPALVQLLQLSDDPQFQIDLLKGMSDGLKGRRGVKMPAGWEALATKLARSPNPQVRDLAQSLSVAFGSASALASLRQTLVDLVADAAARRGALESLLAAKDPGLAAALVALLKDPALRSPALRALAAYDDPRTPGAVLEVYASLTAAEKRDALNTLVSRVTSARALLQAVGQGRVPRADLSADIVRQFRNFKDPALDADVAKHWGVTRDSAEDKLKEIARYKELLTSQPPGDPRLGRAVFARVCQQCHSLFETGGKVGPDITGSNRGDLDYILQNILDPNAVIPNDYRTSNLETKDERVITGIVTRQDDNAVTIVTANETLLVPRADVASLTQGDISMMPEGLLQALTGDEVRALVAYLKQPAQVPMLATPDNAAGFFNGRDLSGWEGNFDLWRVENGEIVGRSPGMKKNEFLRAPLWLGNFRFTCQVKLTPNRENSGIQFRSQAEPGGGVKGFQADMGAGWWGKLYEEHGRGLLWKESGEAHVRTNDWNTYEILAVGSRVRTAINGRPCVDLDDAAGAREGILAFQLHSGGALEVRFKDLQLELNPKPELKPVK
jgi:putative heme-binding domain-containing protein